MYSRHTHPFRARSGWRVRGFTSYYLLPCIRNFYMLTAIWQTIGFVYCIRVYSNLKYGQWRSANLWSGPYFPFSAVKFYAHFGLIYHTVPNPIFNNAKHGDGALPTDLYVLIKQQRFIPIKCISSSPSNYNSKAPTLSSSIPLPSLAIVFLCFKFSR